MGDCAGRRDAVAFHKAQGNLLLGLVVPHLSFSEQPPTLQRAKHCALPAQGFHSAVANDVIHFTPPASLPAPPIKDRFCDRVSTILNLDDCDLTESAGRLWNAYSRSL
jgi:hypothetical protein